MGAHRIAYTILANPFLHNRNSPDRPEMNGPVPAADVLRLHLSTLAALSTELAAILLVTPQDASRRELPGYLNISAVLGERSLPCPLELLSVRNNTLGSYGMYLHAFASTRGRFDYYVFCEDDYVPVLDHFDAALVRMHDATFDVGGPLQRHGVLAGVLQGGAAEPESTRSLHLETSHIMSARSLARIFHHIYSVVGWHGSTSERMTHLQSSSPRGVDPYSGGGIQEGFGLLCTAAGVEMRDWTLAYRSPYWNHKWLVDWTGAVANFSLPMQRALFMPIQLLYGRLNRVKSCCQPAANACKGVQRACMLDAFDPMTRGADLPRLPVHDCCAARSAFVSPTRRRERMRLSVPASAAEREDADAAWQRLGSYSVS